MGGVSDLDIIPYRREDKKLQHIALLLKKINKSEVVLEIQA